MNIASIFPVANTIETKTIIEKELTLEFLMKNHQESNSQLIQSFWKPWMLLSWKWILICRSYLNFVNAKSHFVYV